MPVFHGDLAGHDRGAPAVTLFEDLQQVVTRSGIQRLQPPIVENQYLRRGQRADYAAMPTIHARKGKVGEELIYNPGRPVSRAAAGVCIFPAYAFLRLRHSSSPAVAV